MDTKNTSRQLRYLEEVRIPLHRAGFGTLPVEGEQLPVLLNGTPLCRITGKGSVFYRREDADTPQAEDALYRVEDIAAKTLEYMTAMEAAPQLKAGGLDGDYRILADFGGTVLAGSPSKYGVQFVTWDWDYDRTGVVHGHYFMENYDGAKQDFATRSGLIQKEQLFSSEQLTEIFRCCADSVDEDFFELTFSSLFQSSERPAFTPPPYPPDDPHICAARQNSEKEVPIWIRTSIITASSFCCASFGKAAASAKRTCGGWQRGSPRTAAQTL